MVFRNYTPFTIDSEDAFHIHKPGEGYGLLGNRSTSLTTSVAKTPFSTILPTLKWLYGIIHVLIYHLPF
jgi:hypothetical protein